MGSLIEDLQENLNEMAIEEKISLTRFNQFKDDDLAKYPAIEIKKLDLSAQECEIIANNIMIAISSANGQTIGEPTRALVVLAYNSLMDSHYVKSEAEKPLFQRDELKPTEKWLKISAGSDLDLSDYLTLTNKTDTSENPAKLKLIRSDASDFERKASIGAWAYYHLRLMSNSRGIFWSKYDVDRFSRVFSECYKFDVAYEFPVLSYHTYELLRGRIMFNKSGETLYLLYRSMIIVENDYSQQKRILRGLVFNSPNGLFGGRLWLWTWFKQVIRCASSAKTPMIDHKRLFVELHEVLNELDDEDVCFKDFTSLSRKTLENLKFFYKVYISGLPGRTKSKYYKYARFVDVNYFKFMRISASGELICTLMHIYEKKSKRQIKLKPPMRPIMQRWGDEMGDRISRKFGDFADSDENSRHEFYLVREMTGPNDKGLSCYFHRIPDKSEEDVFLLMGLKWYP